MIPTVRNERQRFTCMFQGAVRPGGSSYQYTTSPLPFPCESRVLGTTKTRAAWKTPEVRIAPHKQSLRNLSSTWVIISLHWEKSGIIRHQRQIHTTGPGPASVPRTASVYTRYHKATTKLFPCNTNTIPGNRLQVHSKKQQNSTDYLCLHHSDKYDTQYPVQQLVPIVQRA